MDNMFVRFDNSLGGPVGTIIAAIIVFVIGWLIAFAIGKVVQNLLARVNLNQRMNSSTGKTLDIENIISKIVFWFIFLIAILGALDLLNLTAITGPFANMIQSVVNFLPKLLGVAIVGAIGWVVATIARTAINAALSKTSLDEKLSAEAGVSPMSSTIADMVYWVILLFVLVIVLGQLGLDGLFAPLTNMLNKAVGFIPNIVGAGLIFFIGLIVAKVVRGIVVNMVASLNLQGYAEKAGISSDKQNSFPKIAGSIVFLLIIIPTIIAALEKLQIEVISRPATNMLNKITAALPNIITAAAILIITYFIMKMVANVIKSLLESTTIDALPAKVGLDSALGKTKVSDLVGKAIIFFSMLFAGIMAADLLGFEQISGIITMFIAFGADIILGSIILFIGFWLANIIAGVVERSDKGSTFLANVVRVLIMGLVLAMGLKAMNIADSIVNLAFGLTLGSVAVAFALSFGLGGREAAARLLRKLQDKAEQEATKAKAEKAIANTQEKTGEEPSITTLSGDEPSLPTSDDI